ncbi:Olfactory receptor 6V1 [Fukomys damarensis]|uniref:Olfactory receptor 6V1 n=1 Tax=Fukomys damarensis TaxID=885580 RepID=A0A091CVH9_FUKDA|nr:Olfactory receptor 6V1 [Fukomys damarensis]
MGQGSGSDVYEKVYEFYSRGAEQKHLKSRLPVFLPHFHMIFLEILAQGQYLATDPWYHRELLSSAMNNDNNAREFVLLGFSHHHEFQTLLFGFILFIYILTILGNLAIMVLTCLDSRFHSPLYFFLCNFSITKMLVTSTVVPRILADLLPTHRTMSLAQCLTQSFFYFTLGSTTFLILTVIAFDCYVDICHPLHYPTIMSSSVCVKLVVDCWVVRTQKAFSTCASHLTVVVLGYGSIIFIYVRTGRGHSIHFYKMVALMTAVGTPFINPFTFWNEKIKSLRT